MIKPSIGRVVLFWPSESDLMSGIESGGDQPLDAHVCHVHSDRMINIGGFDANGKPFARTSVQLLQDDDVAPENDRYACWMDYQKQVAAREQN